MTPADDSPKDPSAPPAAAKTDGSDRRTSDRIPLRSLVEVKIPTWQAFRSVHAVNVSQGGMRISLGPHAPVGIAIDIILTLPNGKRVHLAGKVAHLGGDSSGDIGVRFGDLPPKVLEELDGYIEELRSGRTPGEGATGASIPSGVLIKKEDLMRPHRRGPWIAAVMLVAPLAGAASAAHAAPTTPVEAAAKAATKVATKAATKIAAIDAALLALRGADLAVIDDPGPGNLPSALVATRVAVAPAALAATLGDPRAYREAIPALVRADVIERRHSPGDTGDEQLLEWELEIPLFNLKGKAWIRPRPGGVDLTLVEGDLAPGKLAFTWAPASAGTSLGTILMLESQANVRAAGWLFRRVASHSPFGAAAMNVTAAYVVLRAAAERALHPGDGRARRPQAAPAAPSPAALITDAPLLTEDPALAPFRRGGAIAVVRRSDSGRLASVAVTTPIAAPAPALPHWLASPGTWSAFPGWKEVKALAGDRIAVKDNLPFVDFDTTWQLRRDRAGGFTALAVEGAIRGALFAWDVRAAPGDGRRSLAVFSLYPRLETSGYVPRKFITAEPLLEHGMALALAYVDAMAMASRLDTTGGGK